MPLCVKWKQTTSSSTAPLCTNRKIPTGATRTRRTNRKPTPATSAIWHRRRFWRATTCVISPSSGPPDTRTGRASRASAVRVAGLRGDRGNTFGRRRRAQVGAKTFEMSWDVVKSCFRCSYFLRNWQMQFTSTSPCE